MGTRVLIVLLACWMGHVTAYPSGPPTSACTDMVPRHGMDPQTNAAPFRVSAQSTYCPGKDTTVTVQPTGSTPFRGVFVQARCDSCSLGSTTAIGTFKVTDSQLKTLDCGGTSTAVSHNSRADKTQKTFTWTPPNGFRDAVKFRATFVQNASVFWVGLESAEVKLSTGSDCKSSARALTITFPLVAAMLALAVMLRGQ